MSRYLVAVLAVFSVAMAIPCSAGEPEAMTEEDVAAIKQVREMEAESINSGDPENSLGAYADDVVFMPPNEPATTGRDAARTWLATQYKQFDIDLQYTSGDIKVSGDSAFEHYAGNATFTPKAGGDAIVEQIKGIHIYHRQADGTWKITHDIWSSDAPPPDME